MSRRAPREFVILGSPEGDPGYRLASEKRWREGFWLFRVEDGRDPDAEDQAYIDFLKEHGT
jgi:hypothetical protein